MKCMADLAELGAGGRGQPIPAVARGVHAGPRGGGAESSHSPGAGLMALGRGRPHSLPGAQVTACHPCLQRPALRGHVQGIQEEQPSRC